MATTGILHDDVWYVLVNAAKFTHITSCSLSTDQETIDVTSYDSSKWKDIASGDKSWKVDIEGHYAMDATEGGDEAQVDLVAGTSVTLLVTTQVQGDTTYSGSAKVTSVNFSGSKGSSTKVSVSFMGTGALTPGTVA